jgi:molybdopterin-containing oxidoreductase family molybdopterin binding subunit
LYEAATADYTKGGNMQSVTHDKMIKRGAALMCGPVIPFSDTLVDVKKA